MINSGENIGSRNPEVAVFSIATNGYLYYYEKMIDSFFKVCNSSIEIEFHLFTDDLVEAHKIANRYSNISIHVHEIDSYGWPEATLLRYEIYKKHLSSIHAKNFMHLDADMLFIGDIFGNFSELVETNAMSLVRHPGFYRESNSIFRTWRSLGLKQFLSDLIGLIKYGALGTWETNRKSTAFTPRRLRRLYYCGGIWIGPSKAFRSFIDVNSKNVATDLSANFIAKWHDESHLNKWSTMNNFIELSPSFCFDPTFRQLKNIEGKIEAVNKRRDMIA